MKCKDCPAYGKDNLNFTGCLIKNKITSFPSGENGCKTQYKNILKRIDFIKETEPISELYEWRNINENK